MAQNIPLSEAAAGPKSFAPLESNPDLFTQIIHDIGVLPSLEFQDVYSISEPTLLAFLPRPVLALILVGPTNMEEEEEEEDGEAPKYAKAGNEEDIVWFKQTIRNACGLYAILHSVANGVPPEFLRMSCFFLFSYCPHGPPMPSSKPAANI